MYKFLRNCLIIFILYTLSKNIKSEYDMFLIQDSIENPIIHSRNDSLVIQDVKNDIISEVNNSRNIKNKSYVIEKIIDIDITITNFDKFKYVDNLESSIGFYMNVNNNPNILVSNKVDLIKKNMIIYHELRHYVDDLIVEDFYNKRRYFSDQLQMKKIVCSKDDDTKILNKITYMAINTNPDSEIGLDSTFNSYLKEFDLDKLNSNLKNDTLFYDFIKLAYFSTKNIDYDYYLSGSEYYVRLNHLRRYLIKNNQISVNEKLTKEHFILLLKDEMVVKKWLNGDIDFFYVLIYTDFDILSKRKTLKDIEIERKINTLL